MTNFFTKLASAFTLLALVASFVPAAVFAQEAPAEVVEAAPEEIVSSDLVVETPSEEEAPVEEEEGGIIDEVIEAVVDLFSANEESTQILAVGEKYVNDNAAAGGNGSLGAPFQTIQEAIDAAVDGDTIYVFPGTYSETASGRTVSTLTGATYQFGLFFEEGKDGISIVGIDEDGNVITDANDPNTPDIITNSTSNFGPSGVFVDANNITIQGIDIKSNTSGDNKSIEVIGDGFTLRDSNIDVSGGSVYINDFTGAGTRVNSFTIEGNNFNTGSTLDIASGAGAASPETDRVITGNTFNGNGATTRALISFSGGGQPWYVYPVGGAVITGNTFKDADQYIRARGAYTEAQFDWATYFADNIFTSGAAFVTDSADETRSYSYATYTNVRRIGRTISGELSNAVAGDTVHVGTGLYNEDIVLDKAVALIGSGSDASGTIIKNTLGGDSAAGAVQISASGTATSPVLLKDLRILPNGKAGISVGKFTQSTGTNVEYISLDNVQVIGTNLNACTEQERGLYVDNTSSLKHLTVLDSAFNNLAYGWYFQKSVSADASSVQFVTVDDTTFNHNGLKGIYAEKLSDATFTNVTANENGFSSVTDLAACSYFQPNMAGIDINLKAGAYAAISFVNPTITDNAVGAVNGAGIAVKARADGATYGVFPATLVGVSVSGGTVTGNKTGLRFGEPNKAGAGPTNVVVSGVAMSGNITSAVDNESVVTVLATGNWWGDASGPTIASNVGGTGEVIIENPGLVTYTSWCEAASCVAAPVSTSGSGGGRSGGSRRATTDTTGSIAGGQVLGAETYNFTVDLTIGSTGADVIALQQILIDAGLLMIPAPTGYFGEMTRAALAKWQAAHNITPAVGYFGPMTRAAIKASGTPATTMSAEARDVLIKDLLEKVKELQEKLDALEGAA